MRLPSPAFRSLDTHVVFTTTWLKWMHSFDRVTYVADSMTTQITGWLLFIRVFSLHDTRLAILSVGVRSLSLFRISACPRCSAVGIMTSLLGRCPDYPARDARWNQEHLPIYEDAFCTSSSSWRMGAFFPSCPSSGDPRVFPVRKKTAALLLYYIILLY